MLLSVRRNCYWHSVVLSHSIFVGLAAILKCRSQNLYIDRIQDHPFLTLERHWRGIGQAKGNFDVSGSKDLLEYGGTMPRHPTYSFALVPDLFLFASLFATHFLSSYDVAITRPHWCAIVLLKSSLCLDIVFRTVDSGQDEVSSSSSHVGIATMRRRDIR